MIANGHLHAARYPIGKVFVESEFVVERINREEATRAILIQLAASSLFSKKGGKAFDKKIKELTGSG